MFFKIRCWNSNYIVEIFHIDNNTITAIRYKVTLEDKSISRWYAGGSFPWINISSMTKIKNTAKYE